MCLPISSPSQLSETNNMDNSDGEVSGDLVTFIF